MIQRIKFLIARLLRLFYLVTPFWGADLRLKILLNGGRVKYLLKKFGSNRKRLKKLTLENLYLYVNCVYSKHNGGWCDLPCILCKGRFHDKRDNVPVD